jgi:alcohol dehydrogenase class IV
MTGYAVISNDLENVKSTIVNPKVAPDVSIVDPELMVTLDSKLTAITGFDAFTHAFESYIT